MASNRQNKTAISLQGVGKIYPKTASSRAFAALQDIDLDVVRGETLGVVGDNGSGKTTLFKLIVGITTPSSGTMHINGTVASLLELGAGFHPALSGRDNVKLKAALLGIRKRELARFSDDIFDFAGIGDFADQPVRVYSTGMQSRLAFAIATILRADIIVIDEALSVGDVTFRERAIQRIRQLVSDDERTVLISNHSPHTILETSDRVLWLEKGRFVQVGNPQSVVYDYLNHQGNQLSTHWQSSDAAQTLVDQLQLVQAGQALTTSRIDPDQSLYIDIFHNFTSVDGANAHNVQLGYSLFDAHDNRLWRVLQPAGNEPLRLVVHTQQLHPGIYRLAADAETESGAPFIDAYRTPAQVQFALNLDKSFAPGRNGLLLPPS